MSNELLPQGRAREKEGAAIQRPFRRGLQWLGRHFGGLRSRPASPHSTRSLHNQPTAVVPSGNTLLRSGVWEHDALAPSSEQLIPSNPFQEISPSSSGHPRSTTPFSVDERGAQKDHSPLLPVHGSDYKGVGPADSSSSSSPRPPGLLPQDSFGSTQTIHYGPVYNIGTAGNLTTGPNFGSVTMISDHCHDEFMVKLRSQLKVCAKADHMYYAKSNETALRRCSCTPGTRVNILLAIMRWAIDMSSGGEAVYWLSGQAGAGKTTISYTVARQFENLFIDGGSRVTLGATFFCSRQLEDTRSASAIIRTIVYHLALRSRPFRNALKEYGRFETVDHGPRSQLMGLLVEPWRISAPERAAENEPCYVIPIDALDELEGTGGVVFLSTLLDVVNQEDLSGLKFFVTSRSEPALVNRIESFANKQVCRLEQVPLKESSADIGVYLRENLAECATAEQIEQLVVDADGLFIHAATVVEYVKGRNVREQTSLLERLLSISPSPARRPLRSATASLDSLYLQILETSLVDPREGNDDEMFQECLSILHTFLCTIRRTSTSVAVGILNASVNRSDTLPDDGIANGVLHRLYAVLYSHKGQVMWFHKSFPDFLFNKGRSGRFFCNHEQHHRLLAGGCFTLMSKELRFNIANISSSYQLDHDDPTLPARVNANISMSLRYACVNWSAHLILTSHKTPGRLAERLSEFLELQVLFWMESMNLLGRRGRCQGMLRDAQRWSQKVEGQAELVRNLGDAAPFAAYHGSSKAALSTPHLYLSSLATFSRQSRVVRAWREHFVDIPRFIHAQEAGEAQAPVMSTMAGGVNAVAISPDGTHASSGSDDESVRVWNLSTSILKGHTDEVWAVAYSPDGTRVVSGSWDKSVRVWDLSTGEEVSVLRGHTNWVMAVAYSPDGTHVASGSYDQSVRIWDLSTGDEVNVLRGHTSQVTAVAYSPDGTHIVSGSDDKSVRLWDLSTGEEVSNCRASVVLAVAYSPDGTHIVSGASDMLARVWDLSTGEELIVLRGHTSGVAAVAYCPDGSRIVSGSHDTSVRVWNLSTAEVRVLRGHTSEVTAVAYSPDGTRVVSGSWDKSIRVWDLSTGQEVGVLMGHTSMVTALAYSPDGTDITSVSWDRSVRVWDLSEGEAVGVLRGHTNVVTAVAYSLDGTHIVSGSWDKSIRLWALSTGEEVRVLRGHTSEVTAMAYSPDGACVASGSSDMSVRVWDLSTGEVRVLTGHTNLVTSVAYSPDGTSVASGSSDMSVRVWDLSAGQGIKVLMGHTSQVTAVACSPDGTRIASGSWDASVRIWDLSTGEEVSILKAYTITVTAVAYSPDGNHVVSGLEDNSLQLWDLSTGQEVSVLMGHTSQVTAVAYSPDGNHVVSSSWDKSVRVWDLLTGEEVSVFRGHTNVVTAVNYSPDGGHVVSASNDHSVRVWNASPKPQHRLRYVRQKDSEDHHTGWLVSPTDSSAHLMFVPPTARLPDDSNVLTLPKSAIPYLDFSNAKFGDRWAECYAPAV